MRGQGLWGVCRGRVRARREFGAAAVEFALVLPVLVMLLFGLVTAGLSSTHAIGVTNAVREGARFGATADATSASWADDVISRVRATQFDDSASATNSTTAVCVRLVKAPSTPSTLTGQTSGCSVTSNTPTLSLTSAPAITGIASGTCVVEVWAARDYQISVVVAPAWNGTAVRTSIAKYERGSC